VTGHIQSNVVLPKVILFNDKAAFLTFLLLWSSTFSILLLFAMFL